VQTIRIGFRAGTLAALEILDSFGQTSRMSFSGFLANSALDASIFQFTPPAGADVMRQ
jgi:outer membrane lipoprotein carrier protein